MSVPDAGTSTSQFDSGLQLERTALSWRRTALSVAVGSLVALRLLPDWLGGAAWVIPGVGGLLGSAMLWVISRRRHCTFMAQLHWGLEPRTSGAASLAFLAFGGVGAGILGLALILLAAL